MMTKMRALAGVAVLGAMGFFTAASASAAPIALPSESDPLLFNPYSAPPDTGWGSGTFNPYNSGFEMPPDGSLVSFYGSPEDNPLQDGWSWDMNMTPTADDEDAPLLFHVAYRASRQDDQHHHNEVNQVPEPTSMVLLGTGLLGLASRARKRLAARS